MAAATWVAAGSAVVISGAAVVISGAAAVIWGRPRPPLHVEAVRPCPEAESAVQHRWARARDLEASVVYPVPSGRAA